MDVVTIGTTLTALGGFEFIKWWANRKAYARKENATARDAEETTHERQIERYEARLAARDAKVDAVYRDLRAAEARILELTQQNGSLKLDIELLTHQKCEIRGCPKRVPPGTY